MCALGIWTTVNTGKIKPQDEEFPRSHSDFHNIFLHVKTLGKTQEKVSITGHIRPGGDKVANLVDPFMLFPELETMELFQHSYCGRLSEPARTKKANWLRKFIQD